MNKPGDILGMEYNSLPMLAIPVSQSSRHHRGI